MYRVVNLLLSGVLWIVVAGISVGQPMRMKREVDRMLISANEHFAIGDYYYAADEYGAIIGYDKENTYATYMLAESFRHYFEYEKAEKWYARVMELDKGDNYPLSMYYYAEMLKIKGDYDGALSVYKKFIDLYGSSPEFNTEILDNAILQHNGCYLAKENHYRIPKGDYQFSNMGEPVNTKYLDFAPVIFGSDSLILITSSREGSTGEERYGRFGEEFCDVIRFQLDEQGWKRIKDTKNNFSVFNSVRNDGIGVMSSDKQKYYFTRCDENTGGECAIYVSNLDGDDWGNPIKLNENINPEGVWNAQPALSGSGDTLFFVSKRDGGMGGNDIWYSVRISPEDELWGEAVNLGNVVNTPYNDMSPTYYAPGKVLFFASDGHDGFGGLDVYMAKNINEKVWNIGAPFNSSRDDYHFVLGDKKGYMSSNRLDSTGQGKADIYDFRFTSSKTIIAEIPPAEHGVLSLGNSKDTTRPDAWRALSKDSSVRLITADFYGHLLNADGRPLGDFELQLEDENGVVVRTVKTNDEGYFEFINLPSLYHYKVVINQEITVFSEPSKVRIDFIGTRLSNDLQAKSLFENIYFDFNESDLRPEAKKTLDLLIEFASNHHNVQIELVGNTDSYGSAEYNEELAQNRSRSAYLYLLEHGFPRHKLVYGGSGEHSPIASNKNQIGRQLNRRVEFYVIGTVRPSSPYKTYITDKEMSVRKIAAMFEMSPEELSEANGLTEGKVTAYAPLRVLMGENREMVASVSRLEAEMEDFDFVDEEKYRMFDEGQHVAKYIHLIEPKENYKNKMKSIRSQFGLDENWLVKPNPGEMIYAVQPQESLSIIGERFGMDVEEIRKLNHLKTDRLQIGQKLRILIRESDLIKKDKL